MPGRDSAPRRGERPRSGAASSRGSWGGSWPMARRARRKRGRRTSKLGVSARSRSGSTSTSKGSSPPRAEGRRTDHVRKDSGAGPGRLVHEALVIMGQYLADLAGARSRGPFSHLVAWGLSACSAWAPRRRSGHQRTASCPWPRHCLSLGSKLRVGVNKGPPPRLRERSLGSGWA